MVEEEERAGIMGHVEGKAGQGGVPGGMGDEW